MAAESLRNIPKLVVRLRQRRRMPLHHALRLHPHAAIRAAHIDHPVNEAGIGGGKARRRSMSRHHRRGGVERRSPGKSGRPVTTHRPVCGWIWYSVIDSSNLP